MNTRSDNWPRCRILRSMPGKASSRFRGNDHRKVARHHRHRIHSGRLGMAPPVQAGHWSSSWRYLCRAERIQFLLPDHDKHHRFRGAVDNFLDIQKVTKTQTYFPGQAQYPCAEPVQRCKFLHYRSNLLRYSSSRSFFAASDN